MAKLREAGAYRRIKRPYVRTSKLRTKSYVKGAPHIKIAQYDMGDTKRTFPYELQLISDVAQQVRDNAIEAARQTSVRYMELEAKTGWAMKIRAVPHHIIREKALATGAGADRFQQGMTLSFGKPSGHAAQLKKGKVLFSFFVDKDKIAFAKEAARKARGKFPMHCSVKVFDLATGKEVAA